MSKVKQPSEWTDELAAHIERQAVGEPAPIGAPTPRRVTVRDGAARLKELQAEMVKLAEVDAIETLRAALNPEAMRVDALYRLLEVHPCGQYRFLLIPQHVWQRLHNALREIA